MTTVSIVPRDHWDSDCNISMTGSTVPEWWDPSANESAGAWEPVIGDPGPTFQSR
jgi:hypothetical protein